MDDDGTFMGTRGISDKSRWDVQVLSCLSKQCGKSSKSGWTGYIKTKGVCIAKNSKDYKKTQKMRKRRRIDLIQKKLSPIYAVTESIRSKTPIGRAPQRKCSQARTSNMKNQKTKPLAFLKINF